MLSTVGVPGRFNHDITLAFTAGAGPQIIVIVPIEEIIFHFTGAIAYSTCNFLLHGSGASGKHGAKQQKRCQYRYYCPLHMTSLLLMQIQVFSFDCAELNFRWIRNCEYSRCLGHCNLVKKVSYATGVSKCRVILVLLKV